MYDRDKLPPTQAVHTVMENLASQGLDPNASIVNELMRLYAHCLVRDEESRGIQPVPSLAKAVKTPKTA